MRRWLEKLWWQHAPPPFWLRPFSALYSSIADARARQQKANAFTLPVPVIVVGNIAIGGTGKTPLTIWLVEQLRAMGHRPGVISRGYGGAGPFPLLVNAQSKASECGDEPLLMAERLQIPVCVAPQRLAAGHCLLAAHPELDVLVCDDGLQHYALQRQLEFCVVDGQRGHGNGWRLPAGPLREPPERLTSCDLIFVNGSDPSAVSEKALRFDLAVTSAINLRTTERCPLHSFANQAVHAVAGIGNPQRFFESLRAHGLEAQNHAFGDHHGFQAEDLAFGNEQALLMTEKDAVKCKDFAKANWWYVPVSVEMAQADAERVRQFLRQLFTPDA